MTIHGGVKVDEVWHYDSALRQLPEATPESRRSLRVSPVTRTRAGLDSLWVMDHFFQIPPVGAAEEPMLEGYSALALSSRASPSASRSARSSPASPIAIPGLLVKTVTTLDVLSGGRAWLGIGAGWYEREHLGLGVPFPPVSERFERLEETLQIAQQMWSGEVGPYEGKHYQLAETLCQPMPLSTPRPRIMIGGGGEQKTLRLVARYADACNLFAMPGEEGIGAAISQARCPARALRG